MADFVTPASFSERMRNVVSAAWLIFSRKVGAGLIPINKEASMQLQYAYILRQLLPLIIYSDTEIVELELETGVQTNAGAKEIDILVKGTSSQGEHVIAIEMKCYRTIASSGGTRGAHDIFMKDVYQDLNLLEDYVSLGIAHRGVALVMNDLERFVNPSVKRGKCWDYDISQGNVINGATLTTPIGGKNININLENNYTFNWACIGDMWFMELEGVLA